MRRSHLLAAHVAIVCVGGLVAFATTLWPGPRLPAGPDSLEAAVRVLPGDDVRLWRDRRPPDAPERPSYHRDAEGILTTTFQQWGPRDSVDVSGPTAREFLVLHGARAGFPFRATESGRWHRWFVPTAPPNAAPVTNANSYRLLPAGALGNTAFWSILIWAPIAGATLLIRSLLRWLDARDLASPAGPAPVDARLRDGVEQTGSRRDAPPTRPPDRMT